MILSDKSHKWLLGMFGKGSLHVSSYSGESPNKESGIILAIEQCKPSIIGVALPDSQKLKNPKRIGLFFNSIESIDIVINHLQSIKEMIKEAKDGTRL